MHTSFKSICVAVLLFPTLALAGTSGYLRVNGELKLNKVELEDLVSETHFKGKYFTIKKADSREPVSLSDEPELVKRATTVYYHLSKARHYFKDMNKIDGFDSEKHIVIRIEQDRTYDEHFHFSEKHKDEGHGVLPGAITITEDRHLIDENETWDNEIWFFKKTEFKAPSMLAKIGTGLERSGIAKNLQYNLFMSEFNSWLGLQGYIFQSAGNKTAGLSVLNASTHVLSMALPLAILEVAPKVIGALTQKSKKKLYIDTSYIPEVIYHEYAHFALKGIFDLDKSSAISEAYANYFAYKISGMTQIGKAKDFSNINAKNAVSKSVFSMEEEYSAYAQFGSFTFSVLYDAEKALGNEGEEIIIKSLDQLDSLSNLKVDLPAALITTTKSFSEDAKVQTVKLQAALRKKGI